MSRILVVEDEQSFSDALSFMLRKEGFDVAVADDGQVAVETFERDGADLVLLDIMLPGMSGTEVCRRIRMTSQVPIIMVTAKDSEIDKVVGLELGADDYVTKPFSSRELVARIRAVMRRRTAEPGSKSDVTLSAGNIEMDVERHVVTVDGETVKLPLKEFELLEVLMRNAGRVLTRGQLIDRVWGSDYVGDTKTLDVHVKRLRSKIEPEPAEPTVLVTVRGLGYKLEAWAGLTRPLPGPSSCPWPSPPSRWSSRPRWRPPRPCPRSAAASTDRAPRPPRRRTGRCSEPSSRHR